MELSQRTTVVVVSVVIKDIMPLVDYEQLKENHKGMCNAVEVVATISLLQELRALESMVPTKHLRLILCVVAVVVDETREQLHANDSIYIEEHLEDT